ncbi:MAG: class I SAM-dependent methyltransferase, partial [Pseudomonadota bacterium]
APAPVAFDKYAAMGAYHWRECDPLDAAFNPPLAARYQMIARRLTGGDVVDIGAGDGYLTGLAAARCRSVAAIEADKAGVALARRMLAERRNVTILEADACALPFANESFDIAMMADVIEHLPAPAPALREIARVLRPGGAALITTPRRVAHRVWDPRHEREYAPDELIEEIGAAFGEVTLRFAWPLLWSRLYRTKLGWRALKWAGRRGFNPFLRESAAPDGFGQMLAIASKPKKGAS